MSSPTLPNHQLQNNTCGGSGLQGSVAGSVAINTNALILATPISGGCASDCISTGCLNKRTSMNTPQRINQKSSVPTSNSSSSTNHRHNIIVERTCGGSQTSPTSSAGSSQFIYNAQQDIQQVRNIYVFIYFIIICNQLSI